MVRWLLSSFLHFLSHYLYIILANLKFQLRPSLNLEPHPTTHLIPEPIIAMARIKHTGPKKPIDHESVLPKAAPTKRTQNQVSKPTKMGRSDTSTFSKETIILYESIIYGMGNKVSLGAQFFALNSGNCHLTTLVLQVDHKAVAKALSIKVPAARMRHGRLIAKIAATRPRRRETAEKPTGSSSDSERGDADKTVEGGTLSSSIDEAGNDGTDSQEETPEHT